MQYVILRHDFSEWGTHVSDDVINGSSLCISFQKHNNVVTIPGEFVILGTFLISYRIPKKVSIVIIMICLFCSPTMDSPVEGPGFSSWENISNFDVGPDEAGAETGEVAGAVRS